MFRTGAWDSLAAVGVDSLYQHAQSMLDEDYNWSQASTILNATVGGAPSWIGAYFVRLKALKNRQHYCKKRRSSNTRRHI